MRSMNLATPLVAAMGVLVVLATHGCAVGRGQQTTGAYIDDSAITSEVKTKMLNDPAVAGTSISVETLNGTVMLSGFAKSDSEKAAAGRAAQGVSGVKSVRNEIAVRP